MGHQTKINERNGSPQTAPKALARDVGEFAHDVLTLAELQAQLFVTDARECRRRALVPGLLLVGGVALGLSCIPFALAALALLLIQVFETSYATGLLLATIAGAILSALLCVSGWFLVRKRLAVLQRSQQELVRNLCWIKKVLERNRSTRSDSTDNSWRTVR
jgi:uncharacterized membrane protein YqjE